VIFGDGTQTMDFVHVSDIARANVLAATAPASDVVVNVGTGTETSLNELAERLLTVMGSPLRAEHAAARRVNSVPRRLAAIDTAANEIGFRARITLDDGLRGLVAWWEQERAAVNAQ
jgi:UDP-glucose 4-epimerase